MIHIKNIYQFTDTEALNRNPDDHNNHISLMARKLLEISKDSTNLNQICKWNCRRIQNYTLKHLQQRINGVIGEGNVLSRPREAEDQKYCSQVTLSVLVLRCICSPHSENARFTTPQKMKDERFFTVCRIRQFKACSSFISNFHSVSCILSICFIIS